MDKFGNEQLFGQRAVGSSPLGNNSIEGTSPGFAPQAEVSVNGGIDSYAVLCSHFDGANGATAYSDPIQGDATFVGTAQLDATNPKYGSASLLLDGNSDYVTYPASADWSLTGDFTIDCWVYLKDLTTNLTGTIASQWDGASSRWEVRWDKSSGGRWIIRGVTATDSLSASFADPTMAINTWNHLAFVRSGSSFYVFRNGVSLTGTANTSTFVFPVCASVLSVGYNGNDVGNSAVNGYIDELRISNGIARWTASFIPPTQAYTGTTIITPAGDALETTPREVPLVFDSITGNWVSKLSRINQEDREVGIEVAKETAEDQRFLKSIGYTG